jgi:hypothetical protein
MTSYGGIIDDGVYVGPYTATVNGQSVLVICDDYTAPAPSLGKPGWSATVTTLSTTGFLGDVKFGTTSTNPTTIKTLTQDYDAAAWLAQQIIMDYDSITSTNKTAMDEQIGDLQFALLAIFDPKLIPSKISSNWGGFDSNADYWYNLALSKTYTTAQLSDVEFLTPPSWPNLQEYITVTPEPGSLLLFGTGLLAFGFATRKKQLT